MATFIQRIYFGYRYINEELADPRTQDFFLIGTPWPCIGIIAFYLYFVHKLGPSIMANRKPFNLDRLMQIYDVVQIVTCAYVFYKALVLAWLFHYKFACEPVDYSYNPRTLEIARTVWIYYMLKILDLLDTIFIILRKKQNQVSFLHVYHHGGMVLGGWIATKFIPGGHVTFTGTINSFVHVLMYTHYLVTSLRICKPWWKKYVTQLQLAQFCLILLHFISLMCSDECGFPKWTAVLMIPQNLFMLILFGDFYYKTYVKKRHTQPHTATNGVSVAVSNGKLKGQ